VHRQALEGDTDALEKTLDADPEAKSARYSFETVFMGKTQECSGEPIHLAASRGHVSVVKLLIERGADIEAVVTRDYKPNYDVLHAAVFAEGRGGQEDMLKLLLNARATNSANANGDWPLHLAFKTGRVPLIRLLQEQVGMNQCTANKQGLFPLQLGILQGNMSRRQLAEAAFLTIKALRVFIDEDPQCIGFFLERMKSRGAFTATELANNVHGAEIAKVIRESPSAGSALLDAMLVEPMCENSGWWSLPKRVSFGPRSFNQRLQALVNPPPRFLDFYKHDTVWKFDTTRFESPPWHELIASRKWGGPVLDVDVKVCHVPDIICAEFFSAIASCEALKLFNNMVVLGAISQAYWNGAFRVEIAQIVLTLMGLAMLVMESAFADSSAENAAVSMQLCTSFIGAKGVTDLVQEILQLFGHASLGHAWEYWRFKNVVDISVSAVQIALFHERFRRIAMVFVIFIYWGRIVSILTWAENIARTLIPLRQLASSLGPASLVTCFAFCAFTHAFYTLGDSSENFWGTTVPRSFNTLFTAELEMQPDVDDDVLQSSIRYVGVLIFSIFILNIFISVLGDQYLVEKERISVTFQRHRAVACFNFLTRARVLPSSLCSVASASAVQAACLLSLLALQVFCFVQKELLVGTAMLFMACQQVALIAAYQNPAAPWEKNHASESSYLWLVMPQRTERPTLRSLTTQGSTDFLF
jgi:hypothetical protein